MKINKLLNTIFNNKFIEKGGDTTGHVCVDEKEEKKESKNASLLYGEILPEGMDKALDETHMDIKKSKEIIDLGMGLGKNIIRIFLKYKNVERALGIELSRARYEIAYEAVLKMVKLYPKRFKLLTKNKNCIKICDKLNRILVIKNGDLFTENSILTSDIIICNTDFPKSMKTDLKRHLEKSKKNTKIMTYLDIGESDKLEQMKINKDKDDVFLTSWNKELPGHHFFIWNRI